MEYRIDPLALVDLPQVLALESEVVAELDRPDLLRRNTREMWSACLQPPHYAVGVRAGQALVALAVLYVPRPGDAEDLSQYLPQGGSLPSANYKICLVHPAHRGHALQQRMGLRLEAEAHRQGIALLCSTVSPYNPASIRSLEHLGYRYCRTLAKYGFERALYSKPIDGQTGNGSSTPVCVQSEQHNA